MSAPLAYSQSAIKGHARSLHADRYCFSQNSRCIVMANGFIENGYWYQIQVKDYAFVSMINRMGYDAHVLSFNPEPSLFRPRQCPPDASFRSIVTELLPQYHSELVKKYTTIHYLGHSYGATLLAAFLVGLEAKGKKRGHGQVFRVNKSLAARRNQEVRSYTSLAGFFGVDWEYFLNHVCAPLASLQRFLPTSQGSYPGDPEQILELLYRSNFFKNLPAIPTKFLRYLKYVPFHIRAIELLQRCPASLVPLVNLVNTNPKAFITALAYGSNHESWETFDTVLSLDAFKPKQAHWPSQALKHFTEDLEQFTIPTCFIQGEMDYVTPPKSIRTGGYDAIQSKEKRFATLPGTGHQDILVAKDRSLLHREIGAWFNRFY